MAVYVKSSTGQLVAKTTLAAAVAASDVAGKTIVVTTPQTLAGNTTIPSTITLEMSKGGVITTTGYTLTINGAFVAPVAQVFAGTGGVIFGINPPVICREWFPTVCNFTNLLNAAIALGSVTLGPGTFSHTGLTLASSTHIKGAGKIATILENASDTNSLAWSGSDGTRLAALTLRDLQIKGTPGTTGSGVYIDYSVRYGINPLVIDNCKITLHGQYGVYWANGDSMHIANSEISYNVLSGIYIYGQTNSANITFNDIHHNTQRGIYINQVASNATILGNQINDNGRSGVLALRSEQTSILYNGFNRNGLNVADNPYPAVNIVGSTVSSTKYCEAIMIEGNLFGDNNTATDRATAGYDIIVTYTRTINIISNYFYSTCTGTKTAYIRLYTAVYGANISGNRWTEVVTPKVSALTTAVYTFDDSGDITKSATIIQNGLGNCILSVAATHATGVIDLSAITCTRVIITALDANVTSIVFPTAPIDGQRLMLRFKQDGAGNRTVAGWPADVKLAGGAYTMTVTAAKTDVLEFEWSATASLWYEIRRSMNL
jgi:hypothetical protein